MCPLCYATENPHICPTCLRMIYPVRRVRNAPIRRAILYPRILRNPRNAPPVRRAILYPEL